MSESKMPLYASNLKEIWNRDGSEPFKLPIFAYGTILSNSIEEMVERHRIELRKAIDKYGLKIDENKLMFKLRWTEIINNKITWVIGYSQIVKFNDVYSMPIDEMREIKTGEIIEFENKIGRTIKDE
jgi:hypothetical protein